MRGGMGGEIGIGEVRPGEGDEIGRLTLALEEMRRALRDKLRSTEEVNLDLKDKREHKSPEFIKVNAFGKVPALSDGGLDLFRAENTRGVRDAVLGGIVRRARGMVRREMPRVDSLRIGAREAEDFLTDLLGSHVSSAGPGEPGGAGGLDVGGEVAVAQRDWGGAVMTVAIPRSGGAHGRGEIPDGLPAEDVGGLGDIEMQQARFMRGSGVGAVFLAAWPFAEEGVDERADGSGGFTARSEIETLAKARGLRSQARLTEAGTQPEITGKRLKHMLPRAGRTAIADDGRLPDFESAHTIGDDAIRGEVAATDDVAGAAGSDRSFAGCGTEGATPGSDEEFRHALRGAVRIVTAHRFILAISLGTFAILVALVRGHDDNRGRRRFGADGIKQMCRA